MKIGKDTRGFSLVELIIVIGIMGVLAGVSVAAVGYINTGKTKQSSTKLDNKLDFIQTETMTKTGTAYLYLYQTSDGIYTYVHTTDSSNPDGFSSRTALNSYLLAGSQTGSKICDSAVTATAEGTSGGGTSISMTLSETNMLKIGYSKSTGAFIYSNDGAGVAADFYDTIQLKGKQNYQIKMVQKTGKHFIKEG